MPTIKDVAARAGVSTGTVSNVLTGKRPVSEPAAQRVRQAIDVLGYSPNWMARGLRGVRSKTVGLVVPDNANPFFAELAWSIEQACSASGMSLLLCNTGRDPRREGGAIDMLVDKHVDGIIIATASDLSHVPVLHERRVPLVVIDHDAGGLYADAVLVDHARGGSLAAEHLIALGHRRIACITGLPAQAEASRVAAFRARLTRAGIDLPAGLVPASDTHAEGGYRIAMELFARDSTITAVFAANDLVALGVIRALYDLERSVPQDISIVGYDDVSFATQVVPSLTTIRQPLSDIGRRSIAILEQRLQHPDRPVERWVLPVELVVRESTASIAPSHMRQQCGALRAV